MAAIEPVEVTKRRRRPLRVLGWGCVVYAVVGAGMSVATLMGGNVEKLDIPLVMVVFGWLSARTCFRWSGRVGIWWHQPFWFKWGLFLRWLLLFTLGALAAILVTEILS